MEKLNQKLDLQSAILIRAIGISKRVQDSKKIFTRSCRFLFQLERILQKDSSEGFFLPERFQVPVGCYSTLEDYQTLVRSPSLGNFFTFLAQTRRRNLILRLDNIQWICNIFARQISLNRMDFLVFRSLAMTLYYVDPTIEISRKLSKILMHSGKFQPI